MIKTIVAQQNGQMLDLQGKSNSPLTALKPGNDVVV
jgi:hypothetical protein